MPDRLGDGVGGRREKPRESLGRSLSPLGALSATRPGKRAPGQVAIRSDRSLSFPDGGFPHIGERENTNRATQGQAICRLSFRVLDDVFADRRACGGTYPAGATDSCHPPVLHSTR